MRHVLWIGGPPASGKTTVATSLARTHGLRLYSADTRTWSHRDRALAAADPAAQVEQIFSQAVEEGPRAATVEERRSLLREANLAIVEQVRARFARPWAGGVADDVLRTFPCECAQPGCASDVELRVHEAAARPALADGHR